MEKKLVFIVLVGYLLVSVGCQFNENAPANVVECTAGNVQGRNLSKCLKEMQTLLWLSLGLASSGGSGGQTVTVTVTKYVYTGTLTDSSGQALSGATLTSEPAGITATTDENGNFSFTGASGTYSVTATDASGETIGVFSVVIGEDGNDVTIEVVSGTFSVAVNVDSASLPSTVATPVFSPEAGTLNTSQSITITSTTDDATIFYTIDGSDPGLSSTRYTGAISLADKAGTTITLKAIAYKNDMTRSAIATGAYTVTQTVATPTFSPTPGTFFLADHPTIIISSTTTEATIYYTTDGSTPTTGSAQFVSGISLISVAEYLKIKAYAVKTGWTDSAVASGEYYLMSPVLKTGQTTCASAADGRGAMAACPQTITGQDGEYQKGTTRSYTDNGNGTITDNATGLIWQKCSMGYNNDSTCSDDGETTNNTATWANAKTYCNDLSLGGSSDWRLPGRRQLRSLADYGRFNPAIDTGFFPGTVSSYYWSSSTYVGLTNDAWLVYFVSGNAYNNPKANNSYVRCVSGP